MVESQYLANLLDVQEEVDKHNTCLWALNSKKEQKSEGFKDKLNKSIASISKKPKATHEPTLQLDEECQTCSFTKSRPIVKEAFKMACLNYKPSRVPFRGGEYDRKSLLEFRETILSQTWQSAMSRIEQLKSSYSSARDEDEFRENFLDALSQKLQHLKIEGGQSMAQVDRLLLQQRLLTQFNANPSDFATIS